MSPGQGARAASSRPVCGSRLAPLSPSLLLSVHARCRRVEGGRWGVSRAGGGAESGGGRSFFVSGSAAFSPWQSGQGARRDPCAGGRDPRAQRRTKALHGLPGRGVSPIQTDTHTLSPQPREPGVGVRAGTARAGARGAGLRPPPSPGFGRSANPRRPCTPSPRALSPRRLRLFWKVYIASRWSSGPPGARSRPSVSRDLSRGGAGRKPLPERGTPRSAHSQHGTHQPWSRRLISAPGLAASRTHVGPGPSLLPHHTKPPTRSGQEGRQRGF